MASHKYLYCSTLFVKGFIINNYKVTSSCILMSEMVTYTIFLVFTCGPISFLANITDSVFCFIVRRFVKYINIISIN